MPRIRSFLAPKAPSAGPAAWRAALPLKLPAAARAALGHASDGVDALLGLDRQGPKPITLGGVTAKDYASMEAKVRDLERGAPPLGAASKARLERGEIVSQWRPGKDGAIEELTQGLVNVPLEQFVTRLPIEDWGRNLADWKGGQVRPDGEGRQIERMVLRMPGKDLDMTKVETVEDLRDGSGKLQGARVRWEVLKSDNGTVLTDVGTLRFERYGAKTLVTWHSAHKLDKFPLVAALAPRMATDAATGIVLTDFFTRQVAQYRKIAEQ